jgi:hypothetical protein
VLVLPWSEQASVDMQVPETPPTSQVLAFRGSSLPLPFDVQHKIPSGSFGQWPGVLVPEQELVDMHVPATPLTSHVLGVVEPVGGGGLLPVEPPSSPFPPSMVGPKPQHLSQSGSNFA